LYGRGNPSEKRKVDSSILSLTTKLTSINACVIGSIGPARSRARSAWLAPDPLPDCGEPVVPGRGERAQHDRDQAGQLVPN